MNLHLTVLLVGISTYNIHLLILISKKKKPQKKETTFVFLFSLHGEISSAIKSRHMATPKIPNVFTHPLTSFLRNFHLYFKPSSIFFQLCTRLSLTGRDEQEQKQSVFPSSSEERKKIPWNQIGSAWTLDLSIGMHSSTQL